MAPLDPGSLFFTSLAHSASFLVFAMCSDTPPNMSPLKKMHIPKMWSILMSLFWLSLESYYINYGSNQPLHSNLPGLNPLKLIRPLFPNTIFPISFRAWEMASKNIGLQLPRSNLVTNKRSIVNCFRISIVQIDFCTEIYPWLKYNRYWKLWNLYNIS